MLKQLILSILIAIALLVPVFFETYYVQETQLLREALIGGLITEDTDLLVTKTEKGNLALIRDQMAFHHIAQGSVNGKDWMATF